MGNGGLFKNFTELIKAVVLGGSISLTRWDDTTYSNITFIKAYGVVLSLLQSGNAYLPFPLCFSIDAPDYAPETLNYSDSILLHAPPNEAFDSVKNEPQINATIEYPSTSDGEIKITVTQTHNLANDLSHYNPPRQLIDVGLACIVSLVSSIKGVIIIAGQSFDKIQITEYPTYIHITCTITFNGWFKMKIKVNGGLIVKEFNEHGELVKVKKKKNDLITKNLVLYVYYFITGKTQNLTDTSGNTFEFGGLKIDSSGALAPAGETKYGIILGQDSSISIYDYKLENPLISSEIDYGKCSSYIWQNPNNSWNNRVGITRKITYNGNNQLIVTCIGLITKLCINSTNCYYVLLMKDKYTKTLNKGDSIEVTQYFEVNPTT